MNAKTAAAIRALSVAADEAREAVRTAYAALAADSDNKDLYRAFLRADDAARRASRAVTDAELAAEAPERARRAARDRAWGWR